MSFRDADAWDAWLATNHATSAGIWMEIAKAGSGAVTCSYREALDGALCYGWIDGQKAAAGEGVWLQRFTPRRPRSRWSKINRGRVEALMAAGRMTAAGMAQVERARTDGRWAAAYEGQAAATVPDDLAAALAANPAAARFFDELDRRSRYAILYRVQDARRPETRARRIATFVEMLANRQTLHP